MIKIPDNPVCRELLVVGMNGVVVPLSAAQILTLFTRAQTWRILILLCLFSGVLNAPHLELSRDLMLRMLYGGLGCAAVLALWALQFYAVLSWPWGQISRRAAAKKSPPLALEKPQRRFYSGGAFAVGIAAVFYSGSVVILPALEVEPLPAASIWLLMARYLLAVLLAEVVVIRLLQSQIVTATPPPLSQAAPVLPNPTGTADPLTAPPVLIEINGAQFDIGALWYLKSVEHYVEIVFEDRKTMERVRLRDLVAQLNGVDGIQIHRSFWVHRRAITGIFKANGNHFVVLKEGSHLAIARPRQKAVATWLQNPNSPRCDKACDIIG